LATPRLPIYGPISAVLLGQRFGHIQTAIRYLNVTSRGRRWITGLYSNVFCAERGLDLSGQSVSGLG
jgi:hypothetical protein